MSGKGLACLTGIGVKVRVKDLDPFLGLGLGQVQIQPKVQIQIYAPCLNGLTTSIQIGVITALLVMVRSANGQVQRHVQVKHGKKFENAVLHTGN